MHYIPGGDRTWLALASASLLGYAWLLARWVAARTTEVDAGLPPGIGIGGRAVWTAQRDPGQVPLTHQEIDGAPGFTGPAVVLLHGLGATGAVLLPLADELTSSRSGGAPKTGPSVVVPDLLGHGGSRHIGTDFGLTEQVAAVTRLLDHLHLHEVVLVGHSYGCAVAVAARDPRVGHLVLVCPPAYGDAAEAAERLTRRSWLARRTVAGAPAASALCGLMCLLRPVLQRAAPRLAPGLPPVVARARFEHSYPAYRAALRTLLADNPLPTAIRIPGYRGPARQRQRRHHRCRRARSAGRRRPKRPATPSRRHRARSRSCSTRPASRLLPSRPIHRTRPREGPRGWRLT